MRYFSIFTGIGGFEYGIQQALPNAECVGYSEIDKYAIQTYERHFPEHKNYGDATKIKADELPDFDILCGGFPCQAFSIAGKRRGFEDTRGTLFFDVARIIKIKRPKIVFLENVKGLLNHDSGKTFEVICETLNSLGYLVNYEVINSKNFGVPQNRERVFIIAWHINAIVEDGKTQKMSLLKRTILDYLFQIFLQNLKEVKKLQEHKSKDWVIGYLVLKEIYQNQKLLEFVKIRDGLTILTEEKILELKEEDMWQNIDLLLKEILEESYLELNKSITSTATNQTTEEKIYTYSELLMSMLVVTTTFRKLSKNLWKEMLSFLILIQEGTKYARVIDKTENTIRTDNFTSYESRILQNAERVFIIGHLRGTGGRKIFPIGESNTNALRQIIPGSQGMRVYDDKCSTTISGLAGGWGAKTGLYAIPVLAPDRPKKRQNGRRMKEDGEPTFILTAQDKHGVYDGARIRRLTPVECERLQGFPDGWTEGISDTQRYKCLGNAVTTKVIKSIMEQLIGGKFTQGATPSKDDEK